MQTKTCRILTMSLVLATAAFAQNSRQASMVGGGDRDRGKCTVEVVVDGAAQVDIRGTSANLRTLSGQPAQWRRFECTSPMPSNPQEFRFAGVDGRGRQSLVRDPRNGGDAVVQIDDPDNGSEGYTFDIFWSMQGGGGGYYGAPPVYRDRDNDRSEYRPNYHDSDYYRRYRHGFGTDEAVRVCQQAVMAQASRRFRSSDMHFSRTTIDDSPGRQDWVTGMLDVHRRNHEERFRFSCSVDFESGRVRSADLDTRPLSDDSRWHQ